MRDMDRCCTGCFSDEYLIRWVGTQGKARRAKCGWCGSFRQRSVALAELTETFRSVVDEFFLRHEDLVQGGHTEAWDGELIGDLLSQEFGTFSAAVCASQNGLANEILNQGLDPRRGARTYDADTFWFGLEDDWSHREITEELADALRVLRNAVHTHGHALTTSGQQAGVRAGSQVDDAARVVKRELRNHEIVLGRGTKLHRARVEKKRIEKLSELGAPPASEVSGARANQSGHPLLYLAESSATAIAEVRPAIGDVVVVGDLVLQKDMRICALIQHAIPFSPFEDARRFAGEAATQRVRAALGQDFARPIRPSDTSRDYLFTQYIAGLIRRLGFDGLTFPSSQRGGRQDPGRNYVLFDTAAATVVSLNRHVITAIDYTHVTAK